MQVCTLLQTDNHASTPLLSFLQGECPSCRPTNSVNALEEHNNNNNNMGSILPGVLKNKKIIIMMITGRHLEQRGGVVEAAGTTHLTHWMHAQLRTADVNCGKSELGRQHRTDCAATRRIIAYYIVLPHTPTHPLNGPLSRTTRVSQYQKGKTNLDFTEAKDSEWHQLGRMQVCTSLQTDNHASTLPL